LVTDIATASTHFSGAGKFFDAAPTVLRELQERLGLLILHLEVAHALERQLVGHHPVGQRNRRRDGVAVDHVIEQRGALQLGRRHDCAGDDHVQRGLQADHARQPLRAAGPGQQPELDLGQRDLRIRLGDAVVRAERELESTAHAHARDGGDHRFRRVLERRNQRRQARLARRVRCAELLDIGAAGKRTFAAGDHDGFDAGVGLRAVERLNQSLAQRSAKTVDRRVVQADQRVRAANLVLGAAHGRPFNRWVCTAESRNSIVTPPSMTRLWPVMNDEADDAR
jgi:hypothetical protein